MHASLQLARCLVTQRSRQTPDGVAGSGDAAVFSCFAERAPALLRRLRADNVSAFARLFMAAVMQA